jgi:acyl transferase domain-containing protein
MAARDPIAVVGIGCLFPGAAGPDAFWRALNGADPRFAPFPTGRLRRTGAEARRRLEAWHGSFFEGLRLDLQRFRIPPAYARAVPQTTLMLMHVAQECVADAGFGEGRPLPKDEVDVVTGTCFGFDSTLSNALKVEGVRLAHALAGGEGARFDAACERLRERFGVSSHDRVGEMASSMPARVASSLGLRGRLQAVENADATGFSVLETAVAALHGGQCRAVLAATAQRFDNALVPLALERKGFAGSPDGHPFSGSAAAPMGEGSVALMLMRLDEAERAGHRVYGVIRGLGAARRAGAEPFRYAADAEARRAAVEAACAEAGVAPAAHAYVDCVLPGTTAEAEEIRRALGAPAPAAGPVLGSSAACFGHGFANSALTAVAASALALHHGTLPPLARAWDHSLGLPAGLAGAAPAPWPQGGGARVAGAAGTGVTGLCWHVVLGDPAASAAASASVSRARAASGPAAPPALGRAEEAHEPIAVVGMGGRFGPCASREAFWAALAEGRDGVRPLGEDELPRGPYFSPVPKALSTYAEFASSLGGRDFDLSAYRFFPKRVAALDPAQKLLLQVAAEALADYGLDAKRDRTGRAAVVVASSLTLGRERGLACQLHRDELRAALGEGVDAVAGEPEPIDHLALDGCLASGAAALISGAFGLGAATMAVEAACASSLAALHDAVLALRQRRYDLVLAGGAELPTNVRDLVLCSSQMMLSREKIAPFAEGADGFSPGDGAGMFVLKRLGDALRDGDEIHACITGVGGSSDANSMTAPDAEGQVLAMRRAFAQACYPPASVQYVEAHGTGTKIGDVVEVTSLGRVYGAAGGAEEGAQGGTARRDPLRIGSVKSNFGHTFAAAGSAGLLKTLLAMRHGLMPRTLVRRQVNPELPLAAIPAEIVAEATPWAAPDGVRRAAVNSMGTGGINYHLLVEARDWAAAADQETKPNREG